MTIEIRFQTSPNGRRYALCRVLGYRSLTWQGMSLFIAETSLRDGHVSLGAYRGHLAVPAVEAEAAAYAGALSTERQSIKDRR